MSSELFMQEHPVNSSYTLSFSYVVWEMEPN